MISRHLNRNIIARVCLLACNSIATGWLLYSQKLYIAAGLLLLLFIYQVVELIYFLNRTNRQIAYFFDAIRNDDSTLSFPLNTGNKALDELNISLNKVNELIKTIKFDLREQEQYYSAILENVPIGILTYNEKGTIFLANTAAKKLVGHQHLNHILQIIRTDRKLFNAIKELELGSRQPITSDK